MIPIDLEHTLWPPVLKIATTILVCQSKGTAPYLHATLKRQVNHTDTTFFQCLQHLWLKVIHRCSLAMMKISNHHGNHCSRDGNHQRSDTQIDASITQHFHTLARQSLHSLFSASNASDGFPEHLWSCLKVIFHGIFKHLSRSSFCFCNCFGRSSSSSPIPLGCIMRTAILGRLPSPTEVLTSFTSDFFSYCYDGHQHPFSYSCLQMRTCSIQTHCL